MLPLASVSILFLLRYRNRDENDLTIKESRKEQKRKINRTMADYTISISRKFQNIGMNVLNLARPIALKNGELSLPSTIEASGTSCTSTSYHSVPQ